MIGTSCSCAPLASCCGRSLCVACSEQQDAPKTPDPRPCCRRFLRLNPAQYEHIHDMKNWRNPYLIVRADGVALLDAADNAEIILKPDDLLPRWRSCPVRIGLTAASWRQRRMVPRLRSRTAVAIRRNKGLWAECWKGRTLRSSGCPRRERGFLEFRRRLPTFA